jgi:hypothetical protein
MTAQSGSNVSAHVRHAIIVFTTILIVILAFLIPQRNITYSILALFGTWVIDLSVKSMAGVADDGVLADLSFTALTLTTSQGVIRITTTPSYDATLLGVCIAALLLFWLASIYICRDIVVAKRRTRVNALHDLRTLRFLLIVYTFTSVVITLSIKLALII